jgi:predicted O-methyltransferase YrrM
LRSSYIKNNYGAVLISLIIGKKPEMCIELGVLDGYSTAHIATGLRFNKESFNIDGKLWCWDLWDIYKYNHGNQDEVQEMIDKKGLTSFVKLSQANAFDVCHFIALNSVDFLHVDISNDGDILRTIIKAWHHRIKPYGLIVFEGGNKKRDNIKWMKKYNRSSIREELKSNEIIKERFHYYTFDAFPSMTIIQKKGF